MKVMGIEFSANQMFWVAVDVAADGEVVASGSGKIGLKETRQRQHLADFQKNAVKLFVEHAPSLIAIKEKPETGRMRAGAAAMKMEGIVFANTTCDIDVVSGRLIDKCEAGIAALHEYLQPAVKAAVVAAGRA